MTPLLNRENFDRQLHSLLEQVLILASMVEQAIQQSVDALQRHDHTAARRIILGDQRINEKRYALESECIRLIATQQPMARDVRLLSAILEVITELERIGDYAKGISKINLLMQTERIDLPIYTDLQRMADLGLDMLRRALDAFVSSNLQRARAIPLEDDAVDQLYNRIYRDLIDKMAGDRTSVEHANHLMWAAHNLERMADRVTNICERIVYVLTGEMKELDTRETFDPPNPTENQARSPLTNTNPPPLPANSPDQPHSPTSNPDQTHLPGKNHNHAHQAPTSLPAAEPQAKLPKVLFLCTHNSARSQMAEAFLRKYAPTRFEAFSAGLEPGEIHPLTRQVMAEIGFDLAGQRSKSLAEYLGNTHFTYLITVCDRAEKQCPIFPGMGKRLHWPFEDPSAAQGSHERKLAKFRQVRDEIEHQILNWLGEFEPI